MWDSEALDLNLKEIDLPLQNTLTLNDRNITNISLVPQDKVVLSPLHIKLELMDHFCKSL